MSKWRWFFSLLGLGALAALVWFAGPLLEVNDSRILEGEVARLVTIFLLVLSWVIFIAWRMVTVKHANGQIMAGIAAPSEPEPDRPDEKAQRSQAEAAALRARFQEAIGVLRQSRRGGAANLYELPWYVIIGPPGSGKTTALKHSGLEFPLADRFGTESFRGIGGTRNCDWWFTDEAVLLDTAGRYFTQDSDKTVDRAAWGGFLSLLKRYRKRRPINGVLVTISLSDLMQAGEAERKRHVVAVKQRIQELYSVLGMRFPIYVLFTKSDLVAGFTEFFDPLGKDEREQVWGVTFDPQDRDILGKLGQEYEALLGRLNDRLLQRLDQERDPARRARIYSFPQQMASLKAPLVSFLTEVFRASRYDEQLFLRGVYLTSGTQEGTPLDRVMGAVARSFGLDAQAIGGLGGKGRSYFVTGLLKRVIFPESELVGTNRRVEARRSWFRKLGYAALGAGAIGAVASWAAAYTRNQAYIQKMEEAVKSSVELSKKPLSAGVSFEDLLPELDALRANTGVYGKYGEEHSIFWELGLYQGDELTEAAEATYARQLNRLFAPRIAAYIADKLRNSGREIDPKYAALKAYLMLRDGEHLDPAYLQAWLLLHWERSYGREPEKAKRLGLHLDALLEQGLIPLDLDEGLIAEVRQSLNQSPLAVLVYSRIKRDALARDKKPFVLAEVLGPMGAKVFEAKSADGAVPPIPGFFTQRGHLEVFQVESKSFAEKIRGEKWIFENARDELSPAELIKLDQDVGSLYYAEYIQQWDQLLKNFRIVSFRSPAHGLEVLETLSGQNSAMATLLKAVEQNTNLSKLPAGAGKLTETISEGLQKTKSELASMIGSDSDSAKQPEDPAALLPGAQVARHFADINALVVEDKNGVLPLDGIIEQLGKLYSELDAANAKDLAVPDSVGEGVAARRIKEMAIGQPQPVKDWLLQLTGNTVAATGKKQQADSAKKLADDKKALGEKANSSWNADVLPFCNKAVANRYPIDKKSLSEATPGDFGKVFAPGGLIDAFVQANLKPFIDNTGDHWKWRTVNDINPGFSQDALKQLETASKIRNAYFHEGAAQSPLVELALKPILLDAGSKEVTLDVGGQKLVYQKGAGKFQKIRWPAPDGGLEAVISFQDAAGKSVKLTKEGPWALFRLFDEAKLQGVTSDRLVATFEVEGHSAQFELLANSVNNPFRLTEMDSFHCPRGF